MKVKIIATTDVHGNIFPTNYTSIDDVQTYGMGHIASAIQQIRSQEEHVLLVDNGDAFQGTPLVTYAHQQSDTLENPMASIFNALNYDAINLGNHDFNYGPDILKKFIRENNAPLLTSNVFDENGPLGQTQIIQFGSYKVALIGVVTHYIPRWEQPSHIQGLSFEESYDCMAKEVARVKDDVDYVIGMYHGGLERDPITGEPTERLTGENQGYDMTSIEGLDLLITGHQHRSFIERVNGVLVTQNTFKGQEFVTIDLDLETKTAIAHLHKASDYPVNAKILAPFQELQDKVQVWLDQAVGTLKDGDLRVYDEFQARVDKHPIVSFLNEVQRERTGAQLSSVALFNGITGFNQNITMRDLVSTYPYPNSLVVKRISGENLIAMLEQSARFFALDENNDFIAAPDYVSPKPQHYNYDMIDGIEYTIDVSQERGNRIRDVRYEGQAIKADDSFTLVTNNYRAMGGGNFYMVAESETIDEIQDEMVDLIMQYLIKYSPVTVSHTKNIHVTK